MSDNGIKLQFYRDVISSDSPAPVPSNLSDYWIEYLLVQCESEKLRNELSSELVAAVQKIICLKHGEEFEVSEDELRAFVHIFLTELSLEKICRVLGLEMTRATLETILTDREIGMSFRVCRTVAASLPNILICLSASHSLELIPSGLYFHQLLAALFM